jgi:hypothetical protein
MRFSNSGMVMIRTHVKQMIGHPVVIALGIAIFQCVGTTGEAARAVGATVAPTAPKGKLEPVPPGPKPAEPANATEGAAEH